MQAPIIYILQTIVLEQPGFNSNPVRIGKQETKTYHQTKFGKTTIVQQYS